MAMCKECGEVVGVTDIKNGLCSSCREGMPEEIEDENTEAENESSDSKNALNDVWGIVSFVLGIVGFVTLPILFGPLGFISGLVSKKSAFGIIGMILSAIQVGLVVFAIFGTAAALNTM